MKIFICIFLMVLINIRNAKVNGQENIISDPILILATNYNFGLYTAEILKTDGFNEFQIQPVDFLKAKDEAPFTGKIWTNNQL